jgi:TPR repeat protein
VRQADKSKELMLRGTRYLLGTRVSKDEEKARMLLVQAAELDNADALFLAYMMLANGQGGRFDLAKAFRFLQRAVELGNLEAIYSLGYCYINGGMGNIGYPDEVLRQQVVPVDEKKGLALLNGAVSQGHGLAALRIAEYWEGRAKGDPAMLRRAVEFYEKGMALGEPNCLIHLADLYILGTALPKDRKKARMLYRRAERADDTCAKSTAEQRLQRFDELETLLKDDC